MAIVNSGTPLYSLPPEIVQEILSQVSDPATLRSAVSSCRYLRSSFLGVEDIIIKNVMKRFLGPERIHDAVTIENLRLTSDIPASLSEYLDPKRCLDLPKWSLQEVHHVEQLHHSVQYFSQDLVAKIKSDDDLPKQGFTLQSEPTTAEFSRIERSLYQLEALFRYLKGKIGNTEAMESSVAHFLSNFAPWENEQLACVYEHLKRALSQAIEDVCYNDPKWLEFLARAKLSPEECIIQEFLANGLISAHTAVKAESFERRKEILGSYFKYEFQPPLESFIQGILYEDGDFPILYEFDDDDNLEFIKRPLWQENDPGPEASWRWAHQGDGPESFVFSAADLPLRKFAYVLWDMDRLSALDILSQPWEFEDPDALYAAERQHIEQQHHDIVKRAEIMVQEGKLPERALFWIY